MDNEHNSNCSLLILLLGGGGGYYAHGRYGGAGLGGVLGLVVLVLGMGRI
jgi:hypothetical protein